MIFDGPAPVYRKSFDEYVHAEIQSFRANGKWGMTFIPLSCRTMVIYEAIKKEINEEQAQKYLRGELL